MRIGSLYPELRDLIREVDGSCWEWLGYIDPDGYGRLSVQGAWWRAHRLTYTLLVGPIPDGLVIDHLCRNRCCVNPAHMEPVTIGENVKRGLEFHRAARLRDIDPAAVALRTDQPRRGVAGTPNALKSNCPQGHPYTEENTVNDKTSGGRRCRTCRRRQVREAQRRHRARRLLNGESS